jgi:dihydropteroate synthase
MTKIVGILNITPDSFFDGGRYDAKEAALKQLENLILQGAHIVDIGAESTRPNAMPLSAEQEWARLQEILPQIILWVKNCNKQNSKNIKTSLDSRHYQNIAKALDLGIDIINDVSGCESEEIIKLAAKSGKDLILMHNLGVPADKNKIIDQNLDVIEVLKDWLQQKWQILQSFGVKKQQVIFDPGIGFGKTSEQSLQIIERVEDLQNLGFPLYIGHSNKSFLDILDWPEANKNCSRAEKTKAVSQFLIQKNIDYLRLHKII